MLLFDNDAFIKLTVAGLLDDAIALFAAADDQVCRLGTLPHACCRGRLLQSYTAPELDAVKTECARFRGVPPSAHRLREQLASLDQVDPGEVELFAAAVEHNAVVVTGDKRAIGAVCALGDDAGEVLRHVVPLDAVMAALCQKLGHSAMVAAGAKLGDRDKGWLASLTPGDPPCSTRFAVKLTQLARTVAPHTLANVPQ